ncbi:general stress protein [Microbacterium sp. ZXX196]|uniref:general stress protein n=1 Tax=Microbacterium sp. ZXX196 TaxID=2609291 RepID=UPI0012B79AB0|nr:general stress protein [Microbacterium sp. ZXX196]MTE22886.1 hypothetical protein [Microbacterium sp. ZXX196]
MTMMNARGRTPEVGETVATFTTYEGAQKAVSMLIENSVPARDIAIVGTALRSVEKVTGRLGWAQSAWQGALNGVMLGLLFAAFTVIWVPDVPLATMGGVILIGVGLGMLFRLLSYSIVRRRRDFASVMTVAADHYEVAVSAPQVAESRRLLGTTKRPRTVVAQPGSTEPPRYGIRLSDQQTDQAHAPAADEAIPPATRETPPAPEAQAASDAGGDGADRGAPDQPRD